MKTFHAKNEFFISVSPHARRVSSALGQNEDLSDKVMPVCGEVGGGVLRQGKGNLRRSSSLGCFTSFQIF